MLGQMVPTKVPIAMVQSTGTTTNVSSTTSSTLAYTSNVVGGHLLTVYGGWYTNGTTTITGETLSDTQGNTWNNAIVVGTTYNIGIFWTLAMTSGANSVTINYPAGSGFCTFFIHEFKGVSALDKTATGNAASGATAFTITGPTTTKQDELIFAIFNGASETVSPGSGFTTGFQSQQLSEYKVVSATGTYNATASQVTAGAWIGAMATFY